MRIENLLKRGLVKYEEVDQLQREIWAAVRDGIQDHTLLVAQFEPTYTAGRNTHEVDLLNKELPVIRTDRAGSLTWHGPGQLVIYPLVKLREPVDLIAYIRAVEAAVVDAVRDTWDVPVETIKGRAGVWMRYRDAGGRTAVQRGVGQDRKLCAIGLKVVQATTLHGLALNINPDFSNAFTGIIPCGLADAGVTSLFEEGAYPAMNQAAAVITGQLAKKLQPLLATGTS
ncbi:lipoyl(octanoyl) transferase [Mobiluncus mulieris]|uniref:Octanoyltransferase n=1 Tax=Mobiluncus mulieris TaxID=2052 RepID=A0A8G2HTY0_9ACTO|nr:lipoyl(octanoyl) transferase LipB [Mobiluncus mulieris]MBB5845797.1 lipoyl(octanoyl) transferase [Mobiluncus mulieris]MCU9996791.1 lipoyl(octanoyl) transferase LipB [Mobiluncus mulieris]STO15543.1 Octanoyltransferase [Mobiluncus mulieris]